MDKEFDFTAGLDGFEDFNEIYSSIFGEQESHRKEADSDTSFPVSVDIPEESLPQDPREEESEMISVDSDKETEPSSVLFSEKKSADDKPNREENEEETEFDSRFHLNRDEEGRRKNFSYNGNRVSSTQDLHYEPKQQVEYEELQSSYTAQDSFDALFQDKPEKDDKVNNSSRKFLSFLH